MPTSFYSRRVAKQFPVSYLFLEVFAGICEKSEGISSPEAITVALQSMGVDPPYTGEMVASISRDMVSVRDAHQTPPPSKASRNKRGVGTEMVSWVSSLDMEPLLLLATGGDYRLAEYLYCDVPAMAVDEFLRTHIQFESHRAGVVFEAVVFGTGGKMKGGSESERVLDVSKGSSNEDTAAQLRQFKFM